MRETDYHAAADRRFSTEALPPAGGARRKAVWGTTIKLLLVTLGTLLTASCGTAVNSGTGSSYLILTALTSSTGSDVVQSDVINIDPTTGARTVSDDLGSATFQLAMKDQTSGGLAPSANNSITITQYHVQYVRSDGHNIQGVDVPYAFDGAVTVTVSGTATVTFTLVRQQAKLEAPLQAIGVSNIPLSTIAQVTFYGHDQTGREADVTGNIDVQFANFPG